jgi:hypothetical protein
LASVPSDCEAVGAVAAVTRLGAPLLRRARVEVGRSRRGQGSRGGQAPPRGGQASRGGQAPSWRTGLAWRAGPRVGSGPLVEVRPSRRLRRQRGGCSLRGHASQGATVTSSRKSHHPICAPGQHSPQDSREGALAPSWSEQRGGSLAEKAEASRRVPRTRQPTEDRRTRRGGWSARFGICPRSNATARISN